jgi:hypothetical protein
MSEITDHPYSVRIEYIHEAGMWWAYCDIRFSAADDTLAQLKHRVHNALGEIMGADVEYVEVVMDKSAPRLRNA